MPARDKILTINPYEILCLPIPRSGQSYTGAEIKAAYRRALLRHHPDKTVIFSTAPNQAPLNEKQSTSFVNVSVDDIAQARDLLLDTEWDSQHRNSGSSHDQCTSKKFSSHTGAASAEVIDLGDMDFSTTTSMYRYPCRCGDEGGFCVSEVELEEEVEVGAIYVLCAGCSLAAKIVFQALPDD